MRTRPCGSNLTHATEDTDCCKTQARTTTMPSALASDIAISSWPATGDIVSHASVGHVDLKDCPAGCEAFAICRSSSVAVAGVGSHVHDLRVEGVWSTWTGMATAGSRRRRRTSAAAAAKAGRVRAPGTRHWGPGRCDSGCGAASHAIVPSLTPHGLRQTQARGYSQFAHMRPSRVTKRVMWL